ncbi:MAG TPA: hypothetical protein VFA43_10350 [Gemmatimonadaceae bacterium]|nr:hypothetical protein [Gemmatimonadaceae bacterium]
MRRAPGRTDVGIFLLALATLLLELALTRVLSVALWYHFGFLVISTALLGFGASGVALAVWTNLRERAPLDRAVAILSLAFGIVTLVSFWLMQRIPFDPFSLYADRRQFLFMPLYYLTIAAPFFCSGLGIALLLSRTNANVNRLYAFDLLGAGAGCVAIAFVMPAVGGSGAVVVAAAVAFLAAIVFGSREAPRVAVVGALCAVASLIAAPNADRVLPITITANKRQSKRPPIYTAWNTISRIDVYESPTSRELVFDAGTAGTGIDDLRGGVRRYLTRPADTSDFDAGLALVGKTHPRVLIIGSGAGAEVLDALRAGASSITAVEVNPTVTDIVTRRMRDYWGDLFEQPEVRIVTDEGRSFVRRSHEQYDAIIAVHTISNAAIASGSLSLAENYVLTREAFEDYLDHLSPNGVIFFTRPEAQLPRLFATAREVFARRGLGDPSGHLYAFREPDDPGRPAFVAGFVLKQSALTRSDVAEIGQHTGRHAEILYSPFAPHTGTIYDSLLAAPDIRAVYARSTALLQPATDDRPFFNQHARWSSLGLGTIRDVFSQRRMGRLALEDRPVAEVTLIVLLVQSAIIAAGLILLPLARFGRAGLVVPNRWRYLAYFASLGLGFILAEIALLQRFVLFLGQPIYSYAVILGSLLIFTGVGSALSARITASPRRALAWLLPALIVVLLLSAVVTPMVFRVALGFSFLVRAGVAVILVAPLGVALGTPFPTGLRVTAEDASAIVAWAWGVNGFFTVIGSVAAMILGMAFGFTTVIALAGACYVVALFALRPPPSRRGDANETRSSERA